MQETFADVMYNFLFANYVETLALIPCLTLLMLLTVIVGIDAYIRPELKRIMRCVIAAVFCLVMQNFLEYRLAEGEVRWLARTLTAICGYVLRPVILVLFLRLIAPKMRLWWAWALVGVNAAVYSTALFSHICFWISMTNNYDDGPLAPFCLYVSAFLFAYLMLMSIRVFEPQKRKETWVPLLILALIPGAVFLDSYVFLIPQPVSYLTIATIKVLCENEAGKAADVVEKFGDFLRQNLDTLGTVGLIPFQKELEHTMTYAEIEMVRFENIRVDYDIQDEEFSVPPLTVQPLLPHFHHGGSPAKQGAFGKGAGGLRLPDSGRLAEPERNHAAGDRKSDHRLADRVPPV